MVNSGAAKPKYVKYAVDTVYIGEYIDLKRVQENLKQYNFLNRDHPLVVRLLKDQYAVLTKFGAVTFWNVPNRLRVQFLKELKIHVKAKREYYPYDEDTKVIVGGETDKVTFEKVLLPHLDVDHIKITSFVLSQSVALERYENDIEMSLSEVGVVVENLKASGKPMLGEKEVLKQIGRVLSVKQTAVTHLSLFDKPEEVWESPHLEYLYNRLSAEYELRTRFDVLDEKINYLSDIARLLMDFLAEKRNAFLEIIIIVLIAIDIVLWFIPPFPEVVNFVKTWF
ncbi:MAG: RMD1 family protein [Candidatus Yanofskybacteria bacterium]|nr:RMD1 family protein [Candidatus Yanofskybacteria bacterium]